MNVNDAMEDATLSKSSCQDKLLQQWKPYTWTI